MRKFKIYISYWKVFLLQIMQFSFWKKESPNFWSFIKENGAAFLEDDGEISLSRLSSLIAKSPSQFDSTTAAKAFRFQKVAQHGTQFTHETKVRFSYFTIYFDRYVQFQKQQQTKIGRLYEKMPKNFWRKLFNKSSMEHGRFCPNYHQKSISILQMPSFRYHPHPIPSF